MFSMRHARREDKPYWLAVDRALNESELENKIRDRRGYVVLDDRPVGVLRYNLIWDITPFLTLIYLEEAYRGQGFGSKAMLHWESEMRALGYKMVMTSTQVDEQAQHFYRKLGYIDRGGVFFDNTPMAQPQELFMIKVI